MNKGIIIILVVWLSFPFASKAQEERIQVNETPEYMIPDTVIVGNTDSLSFITNDSLSVLTPDSLSIMAPDSVTEGYLSGEEIQLPPKVSLTPFKPDPNKALLYGLIPGLGQIYNRKYWKLPLVYGAVVGCTYAISWNNRNYSEYAGAFKDIHKEQLSLTDSWVNFVPARYQTDEEKLAWAQSSEASTQLKRGKDYYRRYRDLSIIISAGLYLISILDAYVDAQLFDFDISPDLSMRVEPAVTPRTVHSPQTYGVNCSIKF